MRLTGSAKLKLELKQDPTTGQFGYAITGFDGQELGIYMAS